MSQNVEPKNARPLRVGLLLDTLSVPAWADRLLTRIDELPATEIVLLVFRPASIGASAEAPNSGNGTRERLVQWLVHRGRPVEGSAFEGRSLENRYPHVASIDLEETPPPPADSGTRTQRVQAHDLDLLLSLDSRRIPNELRSGARHGVWSLCTGGGDPGRGEDPGGFWEVIDGETTTTARLLMLTDRQEAAIELARTRTPTHATSVALNRETLYWGALSLIPRQIERLRRLGGDAFRAEVERPPGEARTGNERTGRERPSGLPGLIGRLPPVLLRRLKRSIQFRLYEEHWHLRYAFENRPSTDFSAFEALSPPRDRYWADPMPIYHEDRWHIFFEDFRHDTGRGQISVISFDEHRRPQPARDALLRPYHLSYPFVFHWNGRLLMIPETARSEAVEFYECTRFPDQWTLRRRILEGRYAVDATLERHGDAWYLFANMVENPGASSWTELFLFVNDGDLLEGDWLPHPANPLRSDVSCARPAGPLFAKGEKLFRPAQDCQRRYGGALAIHEITDLGPDRYAERLVERVDPSWAPGLQGVHTYAHRGGMTVIDVLETLPRPGPWARMPNWLHRRLGG